MEKQPAKINYFFGKCYGDLGRTIKNAFERLGETLGDQWDGLAGAWGDLVDDFGFWLLILTLIKTAYYVACIIVTVCITSTLVCILSLVHIVIVAVIMTFIYLWFCFLWLLDTVMCKLRQIVSSCPKCQNKFALPYYQCPKCGVIHTKLKPSKYGILKRRCECGAKLPTTFFNGRQKLGAICPVCKNSLAGGGFLVNISIPVVGGPSSGKTCYVNMAITELEKTADSEFGYDFEYIQNDRDTFRQDQSVLAAGQLPEKTVSDALVYNEFYFSPKKSKVKNQISLCDVGGEMYGLGGAINTQIGYNFANGFLMVIDPLSIGAFRREIEQKENVTEYYGSKMPIDEVLSILIKTLENMSNLSAKNKIDKNLAIVFTKGDLPLIDEKIGEKAVERFLLNDTKLTKLDAFNVLCEQFLNEYEETGFINTVKSKFNNVQYFTCSALGHNVDGTAFNPAGVADPVLWLIDKQSPTIDFKKHWGK